LKRPAFNRSHCGFSDALKAPSDREEARPSGSVLQFHFNPAGERLPRQGGWCIRRFSQEMHHDA